MSSLFCCLRVLPRRPCGASFLPSATLFRSGSQGTQDQCAEFVRTDPAGPAHPVPEPGETDRDVGLGSRHGQAETAAEPQGDRKSTRLNSSHLVSSYAVFCLQNKYK